MAKMNVMTLNTLALYDELLKGYISEQDAKALKTVAIAGNVLKFYTVEEPVVDTAPAFEITLPETDISGLIPKITSATKGHVVIANADGTVADGGVALSDLATKAEVNDLDGRLDVVEPAIEAINDAESGILAQAKAYADGKDAAIAAAKAQADKGVADAATADGKAVAAQNAVNSLSDKVGKVADGETVMGKVAENASDIADLQAIVNELTGDDTNGGSISDTIDAKIAALDLPNTYEAKGAAEEEAGKVQDALDQYIESNDAAVAEAKKAGTDASAALEAYKVTNDAAVQANADAIAEEKARMDAFMALGEGETLNAALDSLKELQDYITNEAADADVIVGKVAALEAIVDGIGGEGEEATVVAYVTKAIEALKIGDYAKAADLTAAVERIAALEGKMTTVEGKVSTLESEMDAVEAKASANETAISGVDGRVTTAEGEIDTLQSEMDTVEGKVAALEGLVGEGYAEIAEQDIRNLFA